MRRRFPAGIWVRPAVIVTRKGGTALLTPGEGGFVSVLLAARGGVVSQAELIDGLWGGEDGGPLSAADVLRQWADRARPKLEPLGIEIVARRGLGFHVEVTP